jgi:hypothetical protein
VNAVAIVPGSVLAHCAAVLLFKLESTRLNDAIIMTFLEFLIFNLDDPTISYHQS